MTEQRNRAKSDPGTTGSGFEVATISPVFKLVFITVTSLTAGALVLNVILVVALHSPNDEAKTLIDTCSTIAKAGFGAIVGLIGGKAV